MRNIFLFLLIIFPLEELLAQNCGTTLPSNLHLTGVTSCTATLSWHSVPIATSYRVKYRINNGTWSANINADQDTFYTFTNLSAATAYQFAVCAVCSNGTKSKFKQVPGTTLACTLPVVNSVTVLNSYSIKINLTAQCITDSIRVRFRHDGLPWQHYSTDSVNNVVLNGLLPNKTYKIQVTTCGVNSNKWTPAVTAKTLPTVLHPNFLIIVLDDARFDTYGCNYGPSFFQSPNIDRIANEGINFQTNFVTTSYCTPGRASIVTGLYGHNNGAVANATPIHSGIPIIMQILRDNGYYTAMDGKWIPGNSSSLFDFIMAGKEEYINPVYNYNGVYKQIMGHSTDIETDTAVALLQRMPRPFCLWLGYKATHDPKVPQPDYDSLYLNDSMPVPDNAYPYTNNYPNYLDLLTAHTIDPDSIPYQYRLCFQLLKGADDAIGRILDTLQNEGILDSTMIFFTSDNGFMYGEHTLYSKRYAYESSMRVPLFVRFPSWFPPNTVITDQMALNIDFTPTMVEASGIQDTSPFDGVSLHDIYNGTQTRQEFFYEYLGEANDAFPPMLAVRSFQYKYIYSGCTSTTEEFYDLVNDPEENVNQIFNPDYAALIDTYRQKLVDLEAQYNYNYNIQLMNCYLVVNGNKSSPVILTNLSTSVVPNPTPGNFNILNPFSDGAVLSIFNSFGVVVYEGKVAGGENEINLNLAAGIYSFEVRSGTETSRGKFVIQK